MTKKYYLIVEDIQKGPFTLEELKSLTDAVWIFSSSTTRTPPGFATGDYIGFIDSDD